MSGLADTSLKEVAARLRGAVIDMSHVAGTPHLGSSLSCADIVAAAYWDALRIDPKRPYAPERDRFILSKGHAATTLYAALAFRGFFPEAVLDTYNKDGSALAEHPGPNCVPGVEAAELLADHVRRLADDVGVPRGLRELGVSAADVPRLADTTLDDACLTTNPRAATLADVEHLFLEAL